MPLVVEAYNFACTRVFLTGMGLAVATFCCALAMQWKSIKKTPEGPGGSLAETPAPAPATTTMAEGQVSAKEKHGLAGFFSRRRGDQE